MRSFRGGDRTHEREASGEQVCEMIGRSPRECEAKMGASESLQPWLIRGEPLVDLACKKLTGARTDPVDFSIGRSLADDRLVRFTQVRRLETVRDESVHAT